MSTIIGITLLILFFGLAIWVIWSITQPDLKIRKYMKKGECILAGELMKRINKGESLSPIAMDIFFKTLISGHPHLKIDESSYPIHVTRIK